MSSKAPGRSRPDFSQLRRAFAFTRPWRGQLALGMVSVAIASLLGLVLPLLVRDLFNEAFAAQGSELTGTDLNTTLLVMIAVFVFQAGFSFLRVYLLGVVGEGVVADVRRTLFSHILSLPVRFFEERKVGEITSRLTSDVATLQSALSQSLAQLTGQTVTLAGGVVLLIYINRDLSLLLLAVVPVIIVAAAFFGRMLRRISTRFQDSVAAANANADEAIAGIRVVKSFVAEATERGRYGAAIDDSFSLGRRRSLARAVFIPSVGLAMFTGIAFVLWFGGQQVLQGALEPGDLVAFLILTLTIAAAVGTFTNLYSQLQEALGASRRIFELLDTSKEHDARTGSRAPGPFRGEVAFRDVNFAYEGGKTVLEGITMDAAPGSVIALVGPSGAGKSTLVSLLSRFHDPGSGQVTLDGHDLRDIQTAELRASVGVVFQETVLFSGSIMSNISYGKPDASLGEVMAAAEAANATEFIDRLPEGINTQVGERGVKLSGGQRQRIAIARALLKDPRVLVLDEATSALDSESESLVQAALDTLMKGRTTFVIAHRLSTVVAADQIHVLQHGRVVQSGTHAELSDRPGLYRDLYLRQYGAAMAPA